MANRWPSIQCRPSRRRLSGATFPSATRYCSAHRTWGLRGLRLPGLGCLGCDEGRVELLPSSAARQPRVPTPGRSCGRLPTTSSTMTIGSSSSRSNRSITAGGSTLVSRARIQSVGGGHPALASLSWPSAEATHTDHPEPASFRPGSRDRERTAQGAMSGATSTTTWSSRLVTYTSERPVFPSCGSGGVCVARSGVPGVDPQRSGGPVRAGETRPLTATPSVASLTAAWSSRSVAAADERPAIPSAPLVS